MRNKWVIAGAAFGVGAVMLGVSGMSALADSSGYDAYQAAWSKTKAEKSLTAVADVTVTDNGTKVLSAAANMKLDHEQQAVSGAATLDGGGAASHSVQMFRQDGKLILKKSDDDVYRVVENAAAPSWRHDGAAHQAPPKALEPVVNALIGNVRDLATVQSAADGSKVASLHLSGSQVPPIASVLGSIAAAKAAASGVPKLTDDVKVEQILLDARISPDNLIEQQTAEIDMSGTDSSGAHHALVIRLRLDLSGFNQTVPDRIDLTGKPTETVQHDGAKRGWHHELAN
jgi:hypothetical protein